MAQFVCRMALPTGEIVERTMVADSESALRRELEEKDMLLLESRRANPLASALSDAMAVRSRIASREFLFFNQEFSALLKAGLPILASLDILIDRRKNQVFKKALVNIRERVRSGEALSEAFAAQGDLFPKLYAASLASGERSGELPSVLKRYISYTRNVMTIQKKVVGAMIYPAILVTASIIIVVIMLFYVIPTFASLFKDLGTTLPWMTQLLVDAATFLRSMWQVLVAAIVGGVVAFAVWKRSPSGRVGFDRLKMKIPLIGPAIKDYAQNRFTRTLSTLLAGGIPLVTSLELAARAVGNYVLEKELMDATVRVREGQSLWESLERTGYIGDMAIEMVKVGESTGALVEMLDNASEFSEEEIDYRLSKMVTLIEPLMLVFMALIVTGMILAIYMPLFQAVGNSKF
ncbi:MAG TPA: type II secretion system F family protein [Candidatus Polarisedimenticolaceae bacterium]|nr:type II secretion system F family protein [Candidatus Polarisedimenticolaceae bacterium]